MIIDKTRKRGNYKDVKMAIDKTIEEIKDNREKRSYELIKRTR